MKKRIVEHPLTSIGGFIIWIIFSALFYQEKINLDTWLMGIGLGCLALGLKDPRSWNNSAPVLVLGMCVLLSSGCRVTYEKCKEKYGNLANDSIRVPINKTVDVAVTTDIPGDSVDAFVYAPLSSDLEAARGASDQIGGIGIVTRVVSDNGRASMKYWRDSAGVLHVRCNCAPETVHDTIPVQIHDTIACPPQLKFQDKDEPTRFQIFWAYFSTVCAWLVIIGILLLILIRLKR